MNRRVAPLVCLCLLAAPAALCAQQPTLDTLRRELALRYLEPGPHMALAKYCHDRGDRLLAFYILESARRTRFDRPQFDAAFRTAFLDRAPFDNSKEAEQALLKQHAGDPSAAEVVAGLAVQALAEEYAPKRRKALLAAMGHDDPTVRWQATAALMAKAGPELDADLKALLKDPDLRKRGLAAYLAVKRWGPKGIAQVTRWLKEKAQLLRFDAISALLQEGGAEGRRVVLQHRPHETNPWLKKLLDSLAEK
jgi:hypothetical protein